jgi:hypothetical protein
LAGVLEASSPKAALAFSITAAGDSISSINTSSAPLAIITMKSLTLPAKLQTLRQKSAIAPMMRRKPSTTRLTRFEMNEPMRRTSPTTKDPMRRAIWLILSSPARILSRMPR